MTVPGRIEAAFLLQSLDPPAWHLRHSRAVAEIAGWLAARAAAGGVALDRRLVESAALLHDVDKALPAGTPERALPHGDGSAAWLAARGHPELAPVVAGHPVTRLIASDADGWIARATAEELLVAYADKRAGQRLESLEARFAGWRRRYPRGPARADREAGWDTGTATVVRARALALESRACALAGVQPGDVRRLRWTGSALRSAADRTRGMTA